MTVDDGSLLRGGDSLGFLVSFFCLIGWFSAPGGTGELTVAPDTPTRGDKLGVLVVGAGLGRVRVGGLMGSRSLTLLSIFAGSTGWSFGVELLLACPPTAGDNETEVDP